MSHAVTHDLCYSVNLDSQLVKTPLNGIFATDDCCAHRFNFPLYKGNAQVKPSAGTAVMGYFTRHKGNTTILFEGELTENTASVELPKACYTQGGRFALVVKLMEDGVISTIFCGEGAVIKSSTDNYVDPDDIIPSLDDLLAQIAAMEAATEEAKAATEEVRTVLGNESNEQIAAIREAGETQIGAVNAAGAAQILAIEEKGERTRQSIPEDWTTLDADVHQLKDTIGDVKNLEKDITAAELEWISGRFTTGVHLDNGKFRYSNPIKISDIHHVDFDSALLKFVFCYLDENGTWLSNSAWFTESPTTPASFPAGAHFARIEVTKQDGTGGVGDYIDTVQCYLSTSYPLLEQVGAMYTAQNTGYVDAASGNDDNDGSINAPYKTITQAINRGHSTIKVAPGDYAESLLLNGRNNVSFLVWNYPNYAVENWETPMVHINGGAEKTISRGVTITDCENIKFDGFWFDNASTEIVYARNVLGLEMRNCIASNAGADRNAFRLINVTGRFVDCKAYNAYDGFNVHGYGDTTFENCVAYDCADDGLSHHDACTGTVIGGEFFRCHKGGISTPTHNAVVNVYGAYCHDNTKYGIYVDAHADTEPHTRGVISGCLLKNNGFADLYVRNAEIVAWGNNYDTKQIDDSAAFNEH